MGKITATTSDLALALGTVTHAASRDQARPVLRGVYLQPGRLGVRAVAADNYRIAIRDFAGTATDPLLLDLDSATELLRLIKRERVTSDVEITVDDPAHATATWGHGSSLGLRLIDGTFPNYLQVIPVDDRAGDRTVGLTPDLFAETCKALGPKGVRALRVTFNEDPCAPIVIRPSGDPDAFAVLMPVRLS